MNWEKELTNKEQAEIRLERGLCSLYVSHYITCILAIWSSNFNSTEIFESFSDLQVLYFLLKYLLLVNTDKNIFPNSKRSKSFAGVQNFKEQCLRIGELSTGINTYISTFLYREKQIIFKLDTCIFSGRVYFIIKYSPPYCFSG